MCVAKISRNRGKSAESLQNTSREYHSPIFSNVDAPHDNRLIRQFGSISVEGHPNVAYMMGLR